MRLGHGRAGVAWPARTMMHLIVLHASIAFVPHAGVLFLLLHASVTLVLHRFPTHLHPTSCGRRLERRRRRGVRLEHRG
jgi:hypothetical protein